MCQGKLVYSIQPPPPSYLKEALTPADGLHCLSVWSRVTSKSTTWRCPLPQMLTLTSPTLARLNQNSNFHSVSKRHVSTMSLRETTQTYLGLLDPPGEPSFPHPAPGLPDFLSDPLRLNLLWGLALPLHGSWY
jgi:hypothetical protein